MSQPARLGVRDESTRRFDVVIRGYDRMQVDELVERIGHEQMVLRSDRDAAATRSDQLARQLAEITSEMDSLRKTAKPAGESDFLSVGPRISNLLAHAEKEASDIRRVAEQEQAQARLELETTIEQCKKLRAEARNDARTVAKQADQDAERLLQDARTHAQQLGDRARAEADEVIARAREASEQADSDSHVRLSKATEEFELSLMSRQAEARRIEQERDQAARHEADSLIKRSQAEVEDRIEAAGQRVAELESHWVEGHRWLSQLRQALLMVPIPDVDALPPEGEFTAADGSIDSDLELPPEVQSYPDPEIANGSSVFGAFDDSGSAGAPEPAYGFSSEWPTQSEPESEQRHRTEPEPEPEPQPERRPANMLGREDILELRQMRRRMR